MRVMEASIKAEAAMATGNSSKRQQLVTAMGNSNGQQAIAAATTEEVATEVTAAKVSMQQSHQWSKGIESRNGGNGSDGGKRQQWQGGWQVAMAGREA